ncbi:MAG: VOC family protein [Bacteroidetes bacterium]|nr:MAG: VOC family protein [Bacteroidota bacterium]
MLGLRTVIYKVADLPAAIDWYTRAFGLEPYFNEDYYVGFDIGGYELGLQPDPAPAAGKTANVLAYWGVANVQKTYDFLLSLGAAPLEAPESVGGALIAATVLDPWGNAIGLLFNPDFKQQ